MYINVYNFNIPLDRLIRDRNAFTSLASRSRGMVRNAAPTQTEKLLRSFRRPPHNRQVCILESPVNDRIRNVIEGGACSAVPQSHKSLPRNEINDKQVLPAMGHP